MGGFGAFCTESRQLFMCKQLTNFQSGFTADLVHGHIVCCLENPCRNFAAGPTSNSNIRRVMPPKSHSDDLTDLAISQSHKTKCEFFFLHEQSRL